tara:strand:- start:6576 stop:9662 length:3087 start_codon:yes stop_codon:yes gene_type:complete
MAFGNISENWLFDFYNQDSYLRFDGTNDYIDCGTTTDDSPVTVNVSATIAFWIRFPVLEDGEEEPIWFNNVVESHYNGLWVKKDGSHRIIVHMMDGSGTTSGDRETFISGTVLEANTWYFVLIGTNLNQASGSVNDDWTIYINNDKTGNVTVDGSANIDAPNYTTGKCEFGRLATGTDSYGRFDLKNFAVWEAWLNPSNITAAYNSGKYTNLADIDSSNLKAYWQFNNPHVATDYINDQNGKIHGATYQGTGLHLAFKDTSYNGNFYHGVIKNTPSIRESIDLFTSRAKRSNTSIEIPDFKYKGSPISEELYGSSVYLNHDVKVYSQIGEDTPELIGCYRLGDISTDGNTLQLDLNSFSPWEGVSFPQVKTATNTYVPTVYGDYTGNAENTFQTSNALFPIPKIQRDGGDIYFASPQAYGSTSRPHYYDDTAKKFIIMSDYADATAVFDSDNTVVIDDRTSRGVYYIRPTKIESHAEWDGSNPEYAVDGNASNTTAHTLDVARTSVGLSYDTATLQLALPRVKGQFTSIKLRLNASVNLTTNTVSGGSSRIILYDATFTADVSNVYDVGTTFIELTEATSTGTTNTSGSGDSSSYTEIDVFNLYAKTSDTGRNLGENLNSTYPMIQLSSSLSSIRAKDILKIDNELMRVVNVTLGSVFVLCERGYSYSEAASHSSGADIYKMDDDAFEMPATINLQALIALVNGISATNRATATFTLKDFYLVLGVENDIRREPQATEDHIENLEYLYLSSNGLPHSITGSTAAITNIHDAHLDLMVRYAGFDVASDHTQQSQLIGWGGDEPQHLNSLKDWKIRYWQLEPTSLIKALEQLQYEGGFIFRFRRGDTSQPEYIYIQDSYGTSDIDFPDVSKYDLNNFEVRLDDFDSINSKLTINYEKHPSPDKGSEYMTSTKCANNSTKSEYTVNSKEDVKEINLSAYVSPTIPTTPSSNPNDDFYTYYDNINGKVRLNVSANLINPKYYSLNVGNLMTFSNMHPEKAFGRAFTDVIFMVTSISRSVGSIKFKAREIGSL